MNHSLYNFLVSLTTGLFNLFSWVNPKWKARHVGLKNQQIAASTKSRFWFHCASAGEYEQIASVIEALSERFPESKVFISFFSASGIEWMKSKNVSWEYGYLPFDGSQKMQDFIKRINPKCLIIAKNELWFNMLRICHKFETPIFLVSASINRNFFAVKGKFFSKHLRLISAVFAQDDLTASILNPFVKNTIVSGDTRISRIVRKAKKPDNSPFLPFHMKQPTIIYGSVHEEDSELIKSISEFPEYNHVVVPHEVSPNSIKYFSSLFQSPPMLSSTGQETTTNFILVDEIGKLADLYRKSSYVYVGGGFGKGIHNIVEALIHNNIVFIGPRFQSFHEAVTLQEKRAIQVLKKPQDFTESLRNVVNLSVTELSRIRQEAQQYVASHQDADKIVVNKISNFLNEN